MSTIKLGKSEITHSVPTFDPVRHRIGTKIVGRVKAYTLVNFKCVFCQDEQSIFEGKSGKNNVLPEKCGNCGQSDCWEETSRENPSVVDDIVNREMIFISIDDKEFLNRLDCERHNGYIIRDRVEAYKCTKCGALHLDKVAKCHCGSTELTLGKLEL
jgi:transcription elongation factor Elf1